MKLTAGTYYKYSQLEIDKCFEMAGYQGSESSEKYWQHASKMLKDSLNMDYSKLTVNQRNFIRGILNNLKAEGMI